MRNNKLILKNTINKYRCGICRIPITLKDTLKNHLMKCHKIGFKKVRDL